MQPRPAEARELAALARLVVGHPLFERYGIEPASLERALSAGIDAGDAVLAAESDGRLGGLAWWSPRGAFGRSPYLRLLVVAPDTVGRGVGSVLMDAFEAAAFATATDAFALVTHDNDAARRFYRRRGYAEVGRLPDCVREGITEVVLRKRRPG
jgi:ribosomal protein S18 acetylase RimI-like enzyme